MSYLVLFLSYLLQVLQIVILIRVVLTWFPVDRNNSLVRLLYSVTEPILGPFRRVIPQIGMFDLSPLAALLVIQFLADAVVPRLARS